MDLFSISNNNQPLAELLRPKNLEEIHGQPDLTEPGRPIRELLLAGALPNLILWGPPGSGKTSFAHVLSRTYGGHFVIVNAVDSGTKALRDIGEEARHRRQQLNEKTIIFVDEIHRYNRAQQDVFLSYIERGDFILIGATTENPSYELNRALLSRCRVVTLRRHDRTSLLAILKRIESLTSKKIGDLLTDDSLELLLEFADGDARKLLNVVESILNVGPSHPLEPEELNRFLLQKNRPYDKKGDFHYDLISAYIKSIRGSDPDAAIYWLARMLAGGEDPEFIARRMLILACEDIGIAKPTAMVMANALALIHIS
ncbi:MAG: AAA family ATPase, partial [Bdellovibrionaceae bacterium]|nr:AAA family ATPase [Pseudobdellovibrionaceae bacterium]